MAIPSVKRGDIFLASFPYGDVPEMKLRPVLLLTPLIGVGTEVLVGYKTSVTPEVLIETDFQLDPSNSAFASTRLKQTSVIRLHKLATIHVTSLKRRLGYLDDNGLKQVDNKLRALLEL